MKKAANTACLISVGYRTKLVVPIEKVSAVKAFFSEHNGAKRCFGFCQRTIYRK